MFGKATGIIEEGSANWTNSRVPVKLVNITGLTAGETDCKDPSCIKRLFEEFGDPNYKIQSILSQSKTDRCLPVYDTFHVYLYVPQSDAETNGSLSFRMTDTKGKELKFQLSLLVSKYYSHELCTSNSTLLTCPRFNE